MEEQYQLEKTLWTDTDFEVMGWHDATVHAVSFTKKYQFLLDIDYIFKWVHPKEGLEIDNIVRANPDTPWNAGYTDKDIEYTWTIETHNGKITFKSVGFQQYVRQQPIFVDEQVLELEVRGGVSFSTDTY